MKHNFKKNNHDSKTKLKKYKRRVKNWKLIIKIFLPALHLTELPNKACQRTSYYCYASTKLVLRPSSLFYCIFPWFFFVYVSFIAFLLLLFFSLYSSFFLFMATSFSFLSVFNVFLSLSLLFCG